VPSGAFVARRNGQVFITGNSGMPKRVRLDLKIDEHYGMKDARPVIGLGSNHGGGNGPRADFGTTPMEKAAPVTGAAHPDAARFVGWDRASRPGWEPIIVARKPIDGTVAQNVQRWGCGGLAIDASRSAPPRRR
jgi:site-specific DNA-methyltransferase (adenine-specific)